MNNPYYHEFSFDGLDSKFVIYAVGSLVLAIILTVLNTRVKPISWRCRGIRVSGIKMRACHRKTGMKLAKPRSKGAAMVLPSTSWDKGLAAIWTAFVCWQGAIYHGAGLLQLLRNNFYPLDGAVLLLVIAVATMLAAWFARKVIYWSTIATVVLTAGWYRINGAELPTVIEKWGLSDVIRHHKRTLARRTAAQQANKCILPVSTEIKQ